MSETARNEILERLRNAAPAHPAPRSVMPDVPEMAWDRETLVEKFSENLSRQTGIVHRTANAAAALMKLTEIAREEGLKRVFISTDEVVAALDLPGWGRRCDVEVMKAGDFADRDAYKEAVFTKAEAGITGVDWAIAESGTMALVHDQRQPRLVSLAPILHIAIIPVDRLLPVYEVALEKIRRERKGMPRHFTFITGPSMTADIQGVPFKGMHGPRRVIAILVG